MEIITTEHKIGDGVSISIGAPHLLNGVIVGKDGVRLKVELETEYAMAQGRVIVRDMFVLPSAIIHNYEVPKGAEAKALREDTGYTAVLDYAKSLFGEKAYGFVHDAICMVNNNAELDNIEEYDPARDDEYRAYLDTQHLQWLKPTGEAKKGDIALTNPAYNSLVEYARGTNVPVDQWPFIIQRINIANGHHDFTYMPELDAQYREAINHDDDAIVAQRRAELDSGQNDSMPYAGNPSDLTYNELYSECVQVFGEDEAHDEMYDIILQVNQDKDPYYGDSYNMEWHNAYMAYLDKAENAGRPSEYTQFRDEVLVVLGTPKELCEQVMSAPEDDDVPLSVGKTLKDATSFIVKAVNTAYGLADQSLFDKDLYENYVEFLKANTGELILKLKRDLEHASLFAFGYETERYYELSDKDKTAYTTDIMRVIRVTNAIAGVDSIAFQPYLTQYYIYWGVPYVALSHYAPSRIEVDDVIKTVNLKHEPMFPNDYMPSRDSEYRSEIDRLIKESLSSGG